MDSAARTFFASKHFAVAGIQPSNQASDPEPLPLTPNPKVLLKHLKSLGLRVSYLSLAPNRICCRTKTASVMAWYHDRSLHPVPITPSRSTIQLQSISYDCIPSPLALADPTQTSLSIVTPPVITRDILKQAQQVGVPAVWLQPGSFDDEDLEYAKKAFSAAVGGLEQAPGQEGWCVLVNGDHALDAARGASRTPENL